MKPNCLYSTFYDEICHHQANSPQKVEYKQLGYIFFKSSGRVLIRFMNIILCKKNLARSITWLDFLLISFML